MIVFLDFEASGLGKHGFPIEVGWAGEDGWEETHLIRPAPGWEDWDEGAAALHGLTREMLQRDGALPTALAPQMVASLSGHDLYASAPSWDGHWLSLLLRAGGQPRHALRLRDTEAAQQGAAMAALRRAGLDPAAHMGLVLEVMAAATAEAKAAGPPAHRALADARAELRLWRAVTRRMEAALAGGR